MALTKVTYSMIEGRYVNVLDYGAYNDGTNATATTTAIQAAINAAAYLWADSSGKLRIKSSGALPGNDTDGTIVGTQT